MPLETGTPAQWFEMGQAGGSRYSGLNDALQNVVGLLMAHNKATEEANAEKERNKLSLAGHLAGAGYQIPQDMLSQYGLGGATKTAPTLPPGAIVTGGTMGSKGNIDTSFSMPTPPAQPLPTGMVAKGATLDPVTGQWKMTAESANDPEAQAKRMEAIGTAGNKRLDMLKKDQGIMGKFAGQSVDQSVKATMQREQFAQKFPWAAWVPGMKTAGGAFMPVTPGEVDARETQMTGIPGASQNFGVTGTSTTTSHTPQQIAMYNEARSRGWSPERAAAAAGF